MSRQPDYKKLSRLSKFEPVDHSVLDKLCNDKIFEQCDSEEELEYARTIQAMAKEIRYRRYQQRCYGWS